MRRESSRACFKILCASGGRNEAFSSGLAFLAAGPSSGAKACFRFRIRKKGTFISQLFDKVLKTNEKTDSSSWTRKQLKFNTKTGIQKKSSQEEKGETPIRIATRKLIHEEAGGEAFQLKIWMMFEEKASRSVYGEDGRETEGRARKRL